MTPHPSHLKTALAVALIAAALTACSVEKSPFPGDNVDRDPAEVWAALMRLPDTDHARQQYQQLDTELRQALTGAIPKLATWEPSKNNPGSRAACGARFPGIGNDGESEHLPDHVVTGNLPDADYEKALTVIGTIAQRYGFDPRPQRLHDAPGSHDAVFHNRTDEGAISFGTALNTSLGLDLGCHLYPASKQRGTPSTTP